MAMMVLVLLFIIIIIFFYHLLIRYLQSVIHVTLFRMLNMFCMSTLVHFHYYYYYYYYYFNHHHHHALFFTLVFVYHLQLQFVTLSTAAVAQQQNP